MHHEVIVCTKDRPTELRRCIDALRMQRQRPRRVVVVDSSTSLVEFMSEELPFAILHLPAEPGLTHQRNIGLALLLADTDIVHFLDDDAVPDPEYIGEIAAAFDNFPSAAGVGATITNLPTHRPWLLERLFNLNSRRQGALLKSGVNILSFTGDGDRQVDWLSGCCMSYRLSLVRGMTFDERRRGNGLGEDVDFSSRARSRGPLIWAHGARVQHLQSMVNRDDAASVVRRGVANRWQLAVDGVGGVRRTNVIYATAGLILIHLCRAVRSRSLYPLLSARAATLGLSDVALRKST